MRHAPALASLAAAVLMAAACSSAPAQMTVRGLVTVPDDPVSSPSPLQDGDQVTVTDPSGKIIGVASLDGDAPQGRVLTLTFGFTVKVPEGETSYGVHVAGLDGITQFTQAQMKAGPHVCAGDACSS
jgi:hypothetical protein